MAIEFKRPDFGNSQRFNNEAIIRKSMGGDNLVVLDSENWPTSQRLACSISGLTEDDAKRFMMFYAASAGQQLFFTDHENITWLGYIITPNPTIVQYGRGCQFKTEFEFEGVKT